MIIILHFLNQIETRCIICFCYHMHVSKFERIIKMKKLKSIAVCALLACGVLSGCGSESADNAWPEKLVLVQMPNENNPDADTKHTAFATALSDYIGIPVEEMEGSDYTVGIEAMASKNVDVMLVSPMSYFQAKERAGAELLVSTPVSAEYRTKFIVRSDSDMSTLEDLKGKSFAFVDQASSSGYLYPKSTLVQTLNLDTDQVETSGYFFSTVAFSGKHDSSIMGVKMGDYDAAAVAGAIIPQMVQAGVIAEGDLKVIGETEVIPNPAYIVRGDLPADLKAKIKEFYLQYADESYFEAIHGSKDIRFVEVTENDYQAAKDLLTNLKIDLGDE